MEKKSRIEWIDICKAFAIYLMVMGHVGVSKNINIFIHTFHMPVFFILSGFCFNEKKNNNIKDLIKKRFLSLMVPYFIFATGLFIFWDVALLILNRPEEMREISNLLKSMFWFNTNASAFGVIQWFLPCLFLSEIIFCIICKITKSSLLKCGITLIVLSILAYTYPIIFNFRLPLALDCSLMATVFFGIGWLIKSIKIDKISNIIQTNKFKSLVIIILFGIVLSPLIYLNGEVNMRTIKYGNYFLFFFNSITYSMLLMAFSITVSNIFEKSKITKFIQWIGRNTLVVLLLNSTIIRCWQVVSSNKISIEGWKLDIANMFISLIVLLICVVLSEFINKFFPFTLGKKRKIIVKECK